ncbi:AcrR family transcriptional regulator [Actinoplanes lutulentus]|uniref:TetR family transcriptional regulator n=1 Tax=Actinoplanes lutulentus TaxID=1287878 RepID=A0A327ZEA7_9ACTN|nr:TetR/AcrR family transcriptional regulator [Actinoplanes lutulentus]MBB2942914.1 AcrR family transcriptional regulator [Actinoplanes lutulentus]RAK38492.1 TetR family transcriptional regulator [Actinoplanes lutulentus]
MGHREDLLQGAKKALLERGYAQTTARDIVAASGTNLASIGYHYGSTKALLTAAMLSAIEDWGDAFGQALTEEKDDDPDDPMLRFWQRVIGSIQSHRALWLASVEVLIHSEHMPDLRAQLAAGLQEGRSGMAAMVTGIAEKELDDSTVRSVGSVQMALMSGVLTQWLTDPATAPSAEEIVAGINALGRPGLHQ